MSTVCLANSVRVERFTAPLPPPQDSSAATRTPSKLPGQTEPRLRRPAPQDGQLFLVRENVAPSPRLADDPPGAPDFDGQDFRAPLARVHLQRPDRTGAGGTRPRVGRH